MTYTSLIGAKTAAGSIANWVSSTRVDPAFVLSEAENLLVSGSMLGNVVLTQLRTREMRKTTPLELAEGASSIALPTRFLDPITLVNITEGYTLTPRDEVWMEQHRSWDDGELDDGMPANFSIYDEAFQFEVAADADYDLRLLFYEKPAPLSAENPTNFLTTRYSNLLRLACTTIAFGLLHDDSNMAREASQLATMLYAVNAENELVRRGTLFETEIP